MKVLSKIRQLLRNGLNVTSELDTFQLQETGCNSKFVLLVPPGIPRLLGRLVVLLSLLQIFWIENFVGITLSPSHIVIIASLVAEQLRGHFFFVMAASFLKFLQQFSEVLVVGLAGV